MIIQASGYGSLEEYVAAAGEPQIEPPEKCCRCSSPDSFRRHSAYWRKVIEGQLTVDVKVPRFMCKRCRLVVSLLFGFLLPYRRFTVRTVAAGVEAYATQRGSYRQHSYELSSLPAASGQESESNSETPFRPDASQLFRWVNTIAARAESLLLQLQKELVLQSKLFGATEAVCPNAIRALSERKHSALNRLAAVLAVGKQLLARSNEIASDLHAYFLAAAETKGNFLFGIPPQHSLQQSSQYVVF